MSPVVLLLVVALLPGVLANFLPTYGAEVTSPQIAQPSAIRNLHFDAKAKFISAATTDYYHFSWYVQKGSDDGKGNFSFSSIYSAASPTLWHTDNIEYQDNYKEFSHLDANTVIDSADFSFPDAGTYRVVVEASKVDSSGNIIEQYVSDDINVIVPSDFGANVLVSTYAPNSTEALTTGQTSQIGIIDQLKGAGENASKNNASFLAQLKSENTLFLALALLIPPLIFAMAIKWFTGEAVSEDLLKSTFYIQCYYFVPVTLSIWATYYAYYFYTADIFFHSDTGFLITILPPLLALIWFMAVETNAIAAERQISLRKARLIVFLCLGIILIGGGLLLLRDEPDVQDSGRKFVIWFYPILSFILLGFIGNAWYKRIKTEQEKLTRVQWITILGFLFTIGCCLLGSFSLGGTPFTIPTIVPTQTETPVATSTLLPAQATQAIAVTATPTQLAQVVDLSTPVPADKSFYTEDFSGALDTWKSFVLYGSSNQVHIDSASGNFHVQLKQDGDTKPAAYFYNEAFTYPDVQLKLMTTNNGNNSNGVSLICRYSDKGWYEFEVSNSGLYWIYEVDVANSQFNQLATGGSSAIQAGPSQNTYVAICQGNTLTLYINDQPIESVTDKKLTEGKIGFGVSSLQGLPVDVKINSLEVSTPQVQQ